MKGILLLGTALLVAAPAFAAPFMQNETASSMNHINTADPKNPIYDAPTTSTSAADANANFAGLRPMSPQYREYREYPATYSNGPAYDYQGQPYDGPRY